MISSYFNYAEFNVRGLLYSLIFNGCNANYVVLMAFLL